MSKAHALLCVPLLLALSACEATSYSARARYAFDRVDGDVTVAQGGGASNDIEAIGLDSVEGTAGFELDAVRERWRLTILTQESRHEGAGTLDAQMSSEDDTIPAGTRVDSGLDVGLHALLVNRVLVAGDDTVLDAGVGVAAVRADLTVNGPGGDRITEDETATVPVAAARAGRRFGGSWWGVLDVLVGGGDTSLWSLDLRGERVLGDGAGSLVVGYRHVDVDLDEGFEAEIALSGPFFGYVFRF